MTTTLTFAYGANMSVVALRRKGVRPTRSTVSKLLDAELALRVPLFAPFRGHVADVRARAGEVLYGVLHEVPTSALPTIDEWEGAGWMYEAVERPVLDGTALREARMYVARPEFVGEEGPCSTRYRDLLLEGALEAGLPVEAQDRIRSLDVLPPVDEWPACLRARSVAPSQPPARWFEVAGAVFRMDPTHRFALYLDRCWHGSSHQLTSFFLRFGSGAAEPEGRQRSWADLDPRERQSLAPFLCRMEQRFEFLGWTPRALAALGEP